MTDASPEASLLVILGPTGSGKSHLGLSLAKALDGEIINCDSVQVYRQLDAGSAKTPVEERRGIPHHLLDVADLNEHFTAGDFQRLARNAISSIHAGGRLPIVVGGTGFYLRALLSGLSAAPQRDEALRERLARIAARRPHTLHRLLAARDALAASRIHANDRQKLIRAIEMTEVSGEPASALQNQPREALVGYRVVKLGLNPPRAQLQERLNARCVYMFNHGLIEEVAELLSAGYPPNSKALQSLGYKQALAVLRGEKDKITAIEECQAKTRQYAKRQATWFRSERDVHWLGGFGDHEKTEVEAHVFLRGIRFGSKS